jgi:hypothetical protein
MMTVTVDQMRPKLLTLDQVAKSLERHEPVGTYPFEVGSGVRFRLDNGWNHGLSLMSGEDSVPVFVSLGDSGMEQEFQLTKDAIFQAAKLAKLSAKGLTETPVRVIEPYLNYWFQEGLADKEFALSTIAGVGRAVQNTAEAPHSNLRLLEASLEGLHTKYGADTEILADYKFSHALDGTWMRLIIPEQVRTIRGSGVDEDLWSLGVQIQNSITGGVKTEISGYLFRWWCTNGSIDTLATSGTYSSKGGDSDVYEWARSAVDGVLGGLEPALDKVQSMTDIQLHGATDDVLRDIFNQYKIPVKLQNPIIDQMIDDDLLTMYSVMNAVTQAANDPDAKPEHVDRLLRVGGDLPWTAEARCDSCSRLLPH